MALASRGTREVEGGTEPIGDPSVEAVLRERARTVWIRTILATVATGGVMLALRKLWGL